MSAVDLLVELTADHWLVIGLIFILLVGWLSLALRQVAPMVDAAWDSIFDGAGYLPDDEAGER